MTYFYMILYMTLSGWMQTTVHSPSQMETGCWSDPDRPYSAFCVYDLKDDGDFRL